MKPFPATASQEKSHVRNWRSKRYLAPLLRPHKVPRHPGLPGEEHRGFPAPLPLSPFYPPDIDKRVDSPASQFLIIWCPQGGGVCHPQEQTKILSVCYGEKRRYELPQSGYPKVNQDLSVCFWGSGDIIPLDRAPCGLRSRPQYSMGTQKQTKTMSVCFWESGGTSCPIPTGYPKGNQDIVCLLLGKRRRKSPKR